ncbi:MAG TPA: formate dehydrogenase accessory sulfurtransferase FdhD [Actinomycetaceae bacterium]|nr:formate dehydrogenase accessory sulfurtransferase FdhD [Actinomycetaceae bacterium]
MARMTKRRRVSRRYAAGPARERVDVLAGEEPLEIRIHGESLAVMMRTPGDDFDLVAGLLLAEGIITRHSQIAAMDYRSAIGADGQRDYNVVDVALTDGALPPAESTHRHIYTSSSCGICGTSSLEGVRKEPAFDVVADDAATPLDHLLELPDRLRADQSLFGRTGGAHAAGLFIPTGAGRRPELVCLREDVGRHNAVDKVVGWALRSELLPPRGAVLQVSGRASFELVQKAAMAGIPTLSAVSAPSALAVELGDELGLTVIGFNRGQHLNIYCHPHRVAEGS